MIIYMATSMTSGLSYIGKSTQDFWKRRSDHKYEALVRKRKSCFYQAIREFGYDDFFWTILANVRNTKQLEAKEKHYIKLFDTVNKGYNTQYR